MLSASTIEILKKLSPHELKKFGDFVNSPYFNTTSSLEIIYKIVLKAHPDYTSKDLESDNMSKKIFASGEYKEKRLKNLCSEFGDLLRKFIGQEELGSRKYELDLHIADGLYARNLFEASEKFIKKSISKNDNGLITDAIKMFYNQRINVIQRKNFMHKRAKDKKDYNDILTIIAESMIARFLRITYTDATTDAMFNTISSERKIIMTDAFLESFDMNKFLEILKQSDHKYYSYLKINYMLYYHTKYDFSEEQFYYLKNEIFKISHKVEKWEASSFIFRTTQIVLVTLIHSDKKYYKDIFDLGKLFCELKIFPDDSGKILQVGTFRDTFMPAIIVEEYEWAEKFAIEYSQYLPEEYRNDELNYCLGILCFKRGKFEESLNYLNKLKPLHLIQKITIRFYYLMNYIELKAYENALSSLQSIKQFHNDRKDMTEFFANKIQVPLKYFQEIIKCEMDGRKIDGLIYQEAFSQKNFNHQQYILEKMEKLK